MIDVDTLRINIFDLNPSSGLGETVLSSLGPAGVRSSNSPLTFQNFPSVSVLVNKLKYFCSKTGHELILMIMPLSYDVFLQAIMVLKCKKATLCPIISVPLKQDAEQIFNLLKAGVTDFKVAP